MFFDLALGISSHQTLKYNYDYKTPSVKKCYYPLICIRPLGMPGLPPDMQDRKWMQIHASFALSHVSWRKLGRGEQAGVLLI